MKKNLLIKRIKGGKKVFKFGVGILPSLALLLLMQLFWANSLDAKEAAKKEVISTKSYYSNIYIDHSVLDLDQFVNLTEEQRSIYHLFSHGRSGELLLEGEWKNAKKISAWIKEKNLLENTSHLNIYGCEFAQGEKGKQAVSYLETVLGVSVAASDDITGIDGDWDLEVGASASGIQVPSYQANLQLCPDPKYSVFVHYPAGANNTNAANYTIISSIPNFVVTVDQTNQNNSAFTALDDLNRPQEWVPLGHNLEFDGTGNIAVRLIENSSSTSSGMWINADAVMFVDQFGKRTIIDNLDATRTGSWNFGGANVAAYNNRYHYIQTGATGNNFVTWTLKESEVIQSDDDQDGIPNGCDLDDDNDGILDLVECTTNDVTNGAFTGNLNGWTTTGNWFNRGGVDAYVNNDAATSSDLSQFVTMNSDEGIFTYDLLALANHPRNAFIEVYVDNVNVGRYSAAEIVAGAAAQGTSYYRVQSAIRGTCGGSTEILFKAIVEAGSGAADDVGVDNVFVGTCDADGDCIANHLEVDSDNDGCGDAIEATGSTYLLGDLDGGLGVDLAIHPIDTNGVPANSTNTGIGTSTNDQIQSLECDQCDSASSLYVDTDGDGIGNACDADDDNDGIIDCDERFTGGVQFNNPLGVNEHFFPNSYNTYTGSVVNPQNVRNGTIESDTINGSGNFGLAVFNATGGGYNFVSNHPISLLEILPYTQNLSGIFSVNDIITFDADVLITIDNPIGDLKVYINGVQDTASTITTLAPITIIPRVSFGVSPAPDYKITMHNVSEFSIYLASSAGTYPNGATFRMNADCLRLDTDGDGIPDDLDLDSDGDGCPDAIEAGGNFTYDDVLNDTLTGGVDSIGLPLVVSPTGQSIGASKDSTDIQACVMPDTVTVAPPACPTCPITACATADDLDTTGGSFASCGAPAGYTQTGPDANGCFTFTPGPGVMGPDTTCIVACDSNGNCDTTYVIIPSPITPDTITTAPPACPTCPITACATADDLDTTGGSFSTCGAPTGYTQTGPDANGCFTFTPGPGVMGPDTTCVVACDSNGNCDTTYVIIPSPITPDTVTTTPPACPTCPVTVCPTIDDVDTTGGSSTTCGAPTGYTQSGPDSNGCYTWTPDGTAIGPDSTCIVVCDSLGNCDTTYVIIPSPITPDSVILMPTSPTAPVTACPTGDDVDTTGGSYASCGAPAGFMQSGPDANGCYTYTPTAPITAPVTTCVIAIDSNGNADTTYVTINPSPITPDTITTAPPACPTCPVTVCPTIDDVDTTGGSSTTCGAPTGYTQSGPDSNGCYTWTPDGTAIGPDSTCIVVCDSLGSCDTTYVIIPSPITPDSVILMPTSPTAPVTACPTGDDVDTTGGSYASCGAPAGFMQSGPDANGCYTYTPTAPITAPVTTCVIAIDSNGNADTTYVTINPSPITPDTITTAPPACPTCPVTVCPTIDDVDTTGGSSTTCGAPTGYTQSGPDSNGCYTWTPDGTAIGPDSTCIVVCDSLGSCDTTYVIIPSPITPDSVILMPTSPTAPVTACPTGDDVDTTGGSYASCGAPAGFMQSGPDANGCYTYTPTAPITAPVTTCVIAIDSNGNADTTYVTINPSPITPDSVILMPTNPTAPVTACPTGDDVDTTGGSFASCGEPAGFMQSGPDANGCYTYTPTAPITAPVTTCAIAIDSNGNADTTYVTINPPVIIPDTITAPIPACLTCPVTACPTGDHVNTTGGNFASCGAPAGYTESGPDSNGCYSYTPSGTVAMPAITCVIAIDSNGNADTTYVTIPVPENLIAPLPVDFGDFNLNKGDCDVSLHWNTLSEQNTSHFNVERRVGSNAFKTIARVEANGTTNLGMEYSYSDKELPTRDRSYYEYRLQVIDMDGTISYSPTRSISMSCSELSNAIISAYPNPTQGNIDVSLQGFEFGGLLEIKLYNAIGQIMEIRKLDITSDANTKFILDLSAYSNGVYILKATDVDTREVYQLKLHKN